MRYYLIRCQFPSGARVALVRFASCLADAVGNLPQHAALVTVEAL